MKLILNCEFEVEITACDRISEYDYEIRVRCYDNNTSEFLNKIVIILMDNVRSVDIHPDDKWMMLGIQSMLSEIELIEMLRASGIEVQEE